MPVARALLFLALTLSATCTAAGTAADGATILLGPAVATYQPLDHGQLAVLRDPAGTLTLDDARAADAAGRFVPLQGNLAAGYTRDIYWLRFRILRDSADLSRWWWLEVLPPFLDDMHLYLVLPDGTVHGEHIDEHTARSARALDHRAPEFRLDLPAGESTGYLRIASSHSTVAVISIWRSTELMQSSLGQYLVFGLYIGLVGAIIALIAINWLLLRETLLLIYLGYVAMLATHTLAASGLAAQYLAPDESVVPHYLVGISMAVATAFGIIFYTRLLELTRNSRALDVLLRATAAAAIFTALAALTDWYVIVAPWTQGLLLLAIAATLPVVVARIVHGTTQDRLASLAFVTYAAFLSGSLLILLGLRAPSRYAMIETQAGTLAQLLLLHAAMTLRMRSSAREREMLERQAAAARIEAEQQRQHGNERDQLLSMIAHEIRTPIAVIDATTQSLGLLDENPPAERSARYGKIRRAVRRLNLLLEIAMKRVNPDSEPAGGERQCDLVEMTFEVVGQFEPQQDQQLNAWMAVESARVAGRADLLRFVLLNLLDNACKYSPAGSAVNIEIVAEARNGRPGYAWAISDQGPGIAAAEREQVFEKYYRGGEETATAGLGLGLYIARQIVIQQGGTLDCKDTPPGQGACFACWLPEAPP